MTDKYALFREQRHTDKELARSATYLQRGGWLPDHAAFPGAASFLVRFLRHQAEPDITQLAAAAEEFIARGRPFLPEASALLDDPAYTVVHQPVPQLIWVDPQRIFPNRSYKDKGDWTRRRELPLETRTDPVLGMAEFARRIGQERANIEGLVELLGPDEEAAPVDLDGWDTPLGAFFRVNTNGNHRAAALAILGAPCIPATVRWNPGPYSAPAAKDPAADEVLCDYRALLHCYGVASYPDPESVVMNINGIISEWPFLIDSAESAARSLPLLEEVAGRRHDKPIGRLPRQLFDDADGLLSAGRRTRQALARNRRKIATRTLRSLPHTRGFSR